MLTLSHVSKSYGKFPAVEDISLEMEHGLYGMLAPNGAGKTTLIKMIATLLVPTQGEILWDGIPVAKLGEKYRDLLGYLPQQMFVHHIIPESVHLLQRDGFHEEGEVRLAQYLPAVVVEAVDVPQVAA